MKTEKKNSSLNFMITGLMVTVFAVVVGLLYDYFFDLNDDVLMKDILSGIYTGSPEGHNIQMLFPISFLISVFYRIKRAFDWYGFFLVFCQYISIFELIYFGVSLVRTGGNKTQDNQETAGKHVAYYKYMVTPLLMLVVVAGLFLGHLLIVQYTFTVALLCSAAATLIVRKKNLAAIIFVIVAFLIRSEMTLLMLPFVLLVLFYRYFSERENEGAFKDSLKVFVVIVAGIIVSLLLNAAGYRSKDWKEFKAFFDNRTSVYDFYQIPDYEENKEFYDSIGLDKSEYELLVNYNFGIDENIDSEMMGEIAAYGKKLKGKEGLFKRVRSVLPGYLYRLRNFKLPIDFEYPMSDSPWNLMTLILYLYAILLWFYATAKKYGWKKRIWGAFWRVAILFGGRTLIWMYILVRGRDPIRITHSLYLIEIFVLLSLVYLAKKKCRKDAEAAEKKISFWVTSAILMLSVVMVPVMSGITRTECKGRTEYNKAYESLEAYFKDNPDNFYFVDVYTSVAYADTGFTYSQKMFTKADNSMSNHILMGGWASKSPIEKEKLIKVFGSSDMEADLLADNAYVVADKDTEMDWLTNYYSFKNKDITIEKIDLVADEFVIYKVLR